MAAEKKPKVERRENRYGANFNCLQIEPSTKGCYHMILEFNNPTKTLSMLIIYVFYPSHKKKRASNEQLFLMNS